MASFNIELNSKPVRNTNEYTMLLRITVDRKPARIKMNYAIPKKDFNPNPKEYKMTTLMPRFNKRRMQ